MRILGVDPGSRCTGYGLIDLHQGGRLIHVDNGLIAPKEKDFSARLNALFEGLQAIIRRYQPEQAAMEDVFMAKNAASALKLGQARGALITACTQAGLEITPYSPTKVKQTVAGYGRADKQQIQHMMKLLLKLPEPAQEDASDALAVAVCHAHHLPPPAQRRATAR